MITSESFDKVDILLSKIVEVRDFPEARKPACRLRVDFDQDHGIKKSSAQFG